MVTYLRAVSDAVRAIADPTRRALIEALHERNDQSLFELCTRLMSGRAMAITCQAVSKHVAVMEEAGVVSVRKIGRTHIHHRDTGRLAEVAAWLATPIDDQEQG